VAAEWQQAMTADELKRLQGFYESLQGIERVLERTGGVVFNRRNIQALVDEPSRFQATFPNIAPPMSLDRLSEEGSFDGGRLYNATGILAHLAVIVGRIRAETQVAEAATTPVIQARTFAFIEDPNLRSIIERDYREAQKAFISDCWKSVIIFSGGAIETILLGLVKRNDANAKRSPKAPKDSDVTRWGLSD